MGQCISCLKKDNILHSQVFKLKFSESVGVDWRILGRYLNIEENYIDIIDHDITETNEKAYSILTKWMQINENPTLEGLKIALRNMRRMDLIRKIDELTKTSNLPESAYRFSVNKETSNSPVSSTTFSAEKEISNSPVSSTKFSAKKETSNSPVNSTKFSAKKDISEICTALKSFYLINYGKICEVQPPLKFPGKCVYLMHKFVDLCIVDAVNTQKQMLYLVLNQKEFLEKQLRYKPFI
ncbi:uncharacterized protein LOC136077142 [Hydra vulgaris]|uniref:Uncharacterized protein LOC136077142 n=1 Tax=Hydra vulgaris TaxID=6087 RepID=A0ABM4BG04_HYDVU